MELTIIIIITIIITTIIIIITIIITIIIIIAEIIADNSTRSTVALLDCLFVLFIADLF